VKGDKASEGPPIVELRRGFWYRFSLRDAIKILVLPFALAFLVMFLVLLFLGALWASVWMPLYAILIILLCVETYRSWSPVSVRLYPDCIVEEVSGEGPRTVRFDGDCSVTVGPAVVRSGSRLEEVQTSPGVEIVELRSGGATVIVSTGSGWRPGDVQNLWVALRPILEEHGVSVSGS